MEEENQPSTDKISCEKRVLSVQLQLVQGQIQVPMRELEDENLRHYQGREDLFWYCSSKTYLKQNSLIDMSVQKARIPGFSGCLEDTRYNTNIYKGSLPVKAGPMDYQGKSGMLYCTWRNLSEDE